MGGKMEIEKILSKEYLDGIKKGLEIAKSVANKQGYDFIFPDLDQIKVYGKNIVIGGINNGK